MEAQQVWHLSSMSTWIFVFCFLPACSGMDAPKLSLESTVFVAFPGEDLHIKCEVMMIPANGSGGVLMCLDPLDQQIHSESISEMTGEQNVKVTLELKNLTRSGEYSCHYKTATVYWFLRVGSESNTKSEGMLDYTESSILGVFTVVLLVFSVVGSLYVFRGNGKDRITGSGDTGRNREGRTESEVVEHNVDAITAPSTSFYASLEPRPRSIYDELDLSAANREPDQIPAKLQKKEPKETIAQTTQDQDEGVFESVYENF
ncbi:NFAT activation molecule 1 [Sebastes fasciatus]|uniref:NFAT activation molecule 1 n=1 Tax=Sebastes fasciatus TaxID=394691 RepID=UPI003D9F268C